MDSDILAFSLGVLAAAFMHLGLLSFNRFCEARRMAQVARIRGTKVPPIK